MHNYINIQKPSTMNFKKIDNRKEMEKSIPFKEAKIGETKKQHFNNLKLLKHLNIKYIYISSIIFLIILISQSIIIYNLKKYINENLKQKHNPNNNNIMNIVKKQKYDINFIYEDYDKGIITDKMRRDSNWLLVEEEARFINGLIRKNKLKNCLEIGVAHGGSSILILNSIKDIENSVLVSLDLNSEVYNEPNKKTGYRVNQYFPELAKNWKLYTGDQPHKFLENLNIKFDFLFLDTTHVSPGELLNFIEALPFLNENAIVVVHDLLWHFGKNTKYKYKFFPSCISLFPSLYGDKILIKSKIGGISNTGAVFLYPNQERHYLDYFLLLLNFWEYIPKDNQINDLRLFIQKYYKDRNYINMFDLAVNRNKKANSRFIIYNNNSEYNKQALVGLGTKWKNK